MVCYQPVEQKDIPPVTTTHRSAGVHEAGILNFAEQLFRNMVTIATTNIIVVTVIGIGGLISGSLTTVTGLVWNGYILAHTILEAHYGGVPTHKIITSLCFHGPVELFAILWAGAIGFRGMKVTIRFLANRKPYLYETISLPEMGGITTLLLIAAVIESAVIILNAGMST